MQPVNSLEVQWLVLIIFTAVAQLQSLVQERTKILQAAWCGQKRKSSTFNQNRLSHVFRTPSPKWRDGKLGCQHRNTYEAGLHTEVCVTGDVCQPSMIAFHTTSRALALGDPGADILKGMNNPWGMRSRN